jgi:NDP-sugar pyrophosphorylase family protein
MATSLRVRTKQSGIDASATVGAGCLLGPDVVIGPGCVIEDGVRIERATLLRGTRVCSHAPVSGSMRLARGAQAITMSISSIYRYIVYLKFPL